MDSNAVDLLTAIISGLGAVAGLIAALTGLWFALRTRPQLVTASVVNWRLWAKRSAVIALALAAVFFGTFLAFKYVVPLLQNPEVKVERLYLSLKSEADLPPIVSVPAEITIAGTAPNVLEHRLHLWLILCALESDSCTARELRVLATGRWVDIVEFDPPTEVCDKFTATFAVLDGQVSQQLTDWHVNGVPKGDELEKGLRDKQIYIIQLVNEEEQTCNGGGA